MTKKMKNSIKELGISLEDLYKGKQQINIHLSNKPFIFHVVLLDRKGIDCKISSFGANLWARTNKGVKMEKYKTLGGLQTELNKLINLKVETDNSLIQYSLNNDVYSF
jgi:hypothetical protein